MNQKEYTAFLKDLTHQADNISVEVWKHYQVKDHRLFPASITDISFTSEPEEEYIPSLVQKAEDTNFTITLEYSEPEKAETNNCPEQLTVNKENVTATNNDEWLILISWFDEDNFEFVIRFTVKNNHL